MSIQNVSNEMQKGAFPAPSSTPVKVINVHNNQTAKHSGSTACLLVYGTTLTDGATGYLSSCILIKTDGAAAIQIFCNQGKLSSCSFVSVA